MMDLMLPFLRDYPKEESSHCSTIYYGRPKGDFLAGCLLFRSAENNSMTVEDVRSLRCQGLRVCYSYEMLDLDNLEFTEAGYQAIYADLELAIEWGYTHIQLSNPYIIDLVTNEFGRDLSVIVSSQLEFNSGRASVFLEALNNPAPVTHIIISQSQLTEARFAEMQLAFTGRQLVVEVDRWLSDIQPFHERYYNVLYGYDSAEARAELKRLTNLPTLMAALRPVEPFLFDRPDLCYKVGEINASASRVLGNLHALCRSQFHLIQNIDLELW